ncbi:hypothetical protein BS78_01G208500 [Paspalum vaginatum]|nr:hypothetical protein BS78_01G208500 [Paspalum vaginatum]
MRGTLYLSLRWRQSSNPSSRTSCSCSPPRRSLHRDPEVMNKAAYPDQEDCPCDPMFIKSFRLDVRK